MICQINPQVFTWCINFYGFLSNLSINFPPWGGLLPSDKTVGMPGLCTQQVGGWLGEANNNQISKCDCSVGMSRMAIEELKQIN